MRILKARYRSGGEFLDDYEPSFLHGGVFHATRDEIPVGESVVVEVAFPELTERLMLRGFVSFQRPAKNRAPGRAGNRAGVGIEFLASERKKRDYLLAAANGAKEALLTRPAFPRRHRRLPVAIAVAFHVGDERTPRHGTLDDIGPGGAFIRTRELQPPGTPVVLSVVPPGAAVPLLIEGRVAWSRRVPGEEGVGVEFRCRDTGGLRRLKELCRRLEATAPLT